MLSLKLVVKRLLKVYGTSYKMKEGTSLKAHLNVFDDLLMKMKAVDLKIE